MHTGYTVLISKQTLVIFRENDIQVRKGVCDVNCYKPSYLVLYSIETLDEITLLQKHVTLLKFRRFQIVFFY